MNDRILNKEDILCMQYAGMKSSRIMNPKLTPEEYAESMQKPLKHTLIKLKV